VLPLLVRRSVYVAIISYHLSGVRIRLCLETWVSAFLRRFPHSNVYFLLDEPIPSLSSIPFRIVTWPPSIGHLPAQLLFRFFADMAHFYANETHRWYWRTTDDTFVCPTNFAAFIDGLDAAHDPVTDRVFKGQVVALPGNGAYVHGGAGWVMSRAAVGRLLQVRALFFGAGWEWSSDDVVIAKAAEALGIGIDDIHTERIMSTDLAKESVAALVEEDFAQLRSCCVVRPREWGAPRPLAKVFAWHGSGHHSFPIVTGSRLFARIPENVEVYHEWQWKLCATCRA
jgi:hypothetical protein